MMAVEDKAIEQTDDVVSPTCDAETTDSTDVIKSTETIAAYHGRSGYSLGGDEVLEGNVGSVSREIETIMAEDGVTYLEAEDIKEAEEQAFFNKWGAEAAEQTAVIRTQQREAEEAREIEKAERLRNMARLQERQTQWRWLTIISFVFAVALFAVFIVYGGFA